MANTVAEQEAEIIEEFALFDDWMGRYEHLIEQGNTLPMIDPSMQDEEHRIRGCQSQVWLHAYEKDSLVYFEANSDAAITRGLIALLIRVLSGQSPDTIIHTPTFIS